MSFFTDYLKDAQTASTACGVNVSVILAQWADETAYGSSKAFVSGHNFAGVSAGGGVNTFPTFAKGLDAYIACLNQSIYDSVRQSPGWQNQCKALGASAWAGSHYNANAYDAGASLPVILANAGIDLINIVNANNLTQYDGTGASAATAAASNFPTSSVGQTINPPPPGMASLFSTGQVFINGSALDVNVADALVAAQVDLSITQASTVTLTLHDPDRKLINEDVFNQASILTLGSTAQSFSLVSVEKQASVLTATFEAYVVAALRTAKGPFTVAAGTMTRTQFATLLIQQVEGAGINTPPESWLYGLDDGYARPSQEQLSRGTIDAPDEDSWTALQRLTSEIQWICFECLGIVYFGPYEWLASQPPALQPAEFSNGINTIDGEWDTGQTTATLTITCTAGSWMPLPGNAIKINGLGPFGATTGSIGPAGVWIVSEIERIDVEEPDVTVTCMLPQPGLPEPTTGGAQAAVGAGYVSPGSQQTTGGQKQAQQALTYAVAQLGKPYVWGGENPATGFDCSGLAQAAYASAGIPIPRTTETQWADSTIYKVAPGISNLLPGDLVYFEGSDGSSSSPGHVAIVSSIDKGNNDVIVIDAYGSGYPIRYDHFGYVNPGGNTVLGGKYFGALRPAP